ncbi:DUF72 domain-containing protein [Paenibacillus planticolens]|uniref:DUF72 domain-containing protein n=1 Tax=Paenibacillus planticolens TaxID=2654976 RepID=A0ABX1ZR74_9BACL|nr:DUF72 domain-containing protein [Paenibacillus planticolens]NOV02567.1 DUF72 domain-containing protein [Paenibacillus planticolens]
MINIGLAGWGDHELGGSRGKLREYGAHFPVVEVDTSFYAIQPERNYIKWNQETPDGFGFIIKAYQGMTGHLRGETPFAGGIGEMFEAFLQSIRPVQEAGKLKTVLFQYPPWFDCCKANVDILRDARERMGLVPVALEFRHQSWFTEDMRDKTLAFMKREGWMHSICDEPQAGLGSVPTVLEVTHPEMTMVRLHGRNVGGWVQNNEANWRDVRYLYNYNRQELLEWKNWLLQLQEQTREVCVVFNNNSGGHAAGNAKELMAMLGLDYEGLAPRQLDLF